MMLRDVQRPWWASLAFGLFTLSASAQTAAPPPATAEPVAAPAGVAATVNGQPIPESALQRGMERVPPEKQSQARPELLNYLIDNILIEQYLQQMQVAIDKSDIDKKVAEIQAELKKNGKDFGKMLKDLRLTEDELRQHITADLRWDKFASAQATEKMVRELFDNNRAMFDGSTVHARHILLTPANDPKATEAAVAQLRDIKKGIETSVDTGLAKLPVNTDKLTREKSRGSLLEEAFAAAAKEKSECPSKTHGGDVGWFRRVGFMVEPFAKAAFALEPNQMSDVVHTQFGYHLILVTERKAGREIKFEDAKDMARELYCERLREAITTQMRQRSKVVVYAAPKK